MEACALPATTDAATAASGPLGISAYAGDEPVQAGSAILHTELIGRCVDGARIVSRFGSDLVVGSAPLDEVELLLGRAEFRSAAYLLSLVGGDGLGFDLIATDTDAADPVLPCAKVGETIRSARRWREHRRRPPVPTDRVWLVATLRPYGFGKDALLALQHALTHQALRARRCRVVGASPEASWLNEVDPGLMRRWLNDVRALLIGGGCHLLEPRGVAMRTSVVVGPVQHEPPGADVVPPAAPAPPPLKRGYRLVPEPLAAESGASRCILAWRGVHATATVLANGNVVIEAGSLFALKPRSGVQDCIARKVERMQAAGLFEQAGDGMRRLTRPIQVSTLTNAFRLATISNLPGKGRWAPAT